MLAFPEMLKSLTPIKGAFSKGSSFRKHFFEKVADILADRVTVDELHGKKVKRIILKLRKN